MKKFAKLSDVKKSREMNIEEMKKAKAGYVDVIVKPEPIVMYQAPIYIHDDYIIHDQAIAVLPTDPADTSDTARVSS